MCHFAGHRRHFNLASADLIFGQPTGARSPVSSRVNNRDAHAILALARQTFRQISNLPATDSTLVPVRRLAHERVTRGRKLRTASVHRLVYIMLYMQSVPE